MTTVCDDCDVDVLTGSAGIDLFIYNQADGTGVADQVTDLSAQEKQYDLDEFVVWVGP